MSPVGMACLSALCGQGWSLLCHLWAWLVFLPSVGRAGLYYVTLWAWLVFLPSVGRVKNVKLSVLSSPTPES